MTNQFQILTLSAGVAACSFVGVASATTYEGPFVGTTVTYSDVQDQDDLFGPPTVSGDSITFTPQSFNVESQNGGFDFEDGFLSTLIESNDGQAITDFTLTEAGAFRLGPFADSGTERTSVDVSVFFTATILEVDGAPSGGQILVASDVLFQEDLGGSNLQGAWIGSTRVNLAALASDAGITGDITKVRLTLDNELLATSEAGSFAFIDKKAVSGVTITVPEPTSAMLVLGGGALLLRRRFKA